MFSFRIGRSYWLMALGLLVLHMAAPVTAPAQEAMAFRLPANLDPGAVLAHQNRVFNQLYAPPLRGRPFILTAGDAGNAFLKPPVQITLDPRLSLEPPRPPGPVLIIDTP